MARGILQKRDFLIDYIRRNAPVSRFRIAREFEMNPSTVGNIVEGLLADGLILEARGQREPASVGRPPILLSPNPGAGRFVGLDMYRKRLTGVITDFTGAVLRSATIPLGTRPSRKAVHRSILELIQDLTCRGPCTASVLRAIGLGFPGLVDRDAGIALSYHPIRDWHEVPIRDALETAFGVPVFLEHNSNTMALGEALCGDAREHTTVVSILLRTGVSIGLVQHGEINRQSPLGAGELGHTIIHVNGPKCWCGSRGCLECYVSGWALRRRVRRVLKRNPGWPVRAAFGETEEDFDPAVICRMAAQGDREATEILAEMFRHLAVGINTVARLLSPEAVVINGTFNSAGDLLTRCVMESFEKPRHHPVHVPRLIISTQDDTIGATGAALMAAAWFCNPLYRLPA